VATAQDAVKRAVKGYGAPAVDTRAAFIDSQTAGVSAFVGIIYVMLAMAILIALGSIANTLSLSRFTSARANSACCAPSANHDASCAR
jgi:putative ABC transport system permease protein